MSAAILASAGAQGLANINKAMVESASYKVQSMQAGTSARMARLQGDRDALSLIQQFNKSMASDTVMAAAQGRSGGSVSAIASASEAQFNWDSDFTELSAKIREEGYLAQKKQAEIASDYAMIGGITSALTGAGASAASSLYSIGGSTKPQTLSNNPNDMQF